MSARSLPRPSAGCFAGKTRTAVPLLALLSLLLVAITAPPAKAVPSEAPTPTWVTDGIVKATAVSGNTAYLGGKFDHVGVASGPAAAFDATTAEMSNTAAISGSVFDWVEAVEADGEAAGGYYVGGSFSHARGEARSGVVHVRADGSLDPSFAPGFSESDAVKAIVVDDGVVYVGGSFTEVGGEERNRIAAFDAESGELLHWAPHLNGNVSALAVDGNYVYIGGGFTTVDGESRSRIASVGAPGTGEGEGELTGWNPILNNEVFALEVFGSTLYAGGNFNAIDGEERHALASFDLSTSPSGEPDLTAWAPASQHNVLAFAADESGEVIYVGGEFTQMNGVSHQRLVALDAEDGSNIETWTAGTNQAVRDLIVAGGKVYATGNFTEAGGEPRRGAAAFNAEGSGELLDWNPGLFGSGYAIAVSGSDVIVGGLYYGAGNEERGNLAAIDLSTGEATDWKPRASHDVLSLAVSKDGEIVYIGGAFSEVNGEPRGRLAGLRAQDGELIAWAPNPNGTVKAMAVDDSRLYVGGEFPSIEGSGNWSRLAAFDVEGEEATIVDAWRPQPNNGVESLAIDDSHLYVGGYFTEVGGQPRDNLAALAPSTGEADPSWDPSPDNRVAALVATGTSLYVGGRFTQVDEISHLRLAEIDATGAVTGWSPELNQTVLGLAFDGSTVYAGGEFTTADGSPRKRLAAYDAGTGDLLDWNPAASAAVNSLAGSGSTLIAGGSFQSLDYGPQRGIAAFETNPSLTVATTGAGTGTITSSPAGIECGSICSSAFAPGLEVTLTATPDSGSEFAGWSGGGCSGTGPCVVTLDADTEVSAAFAVAKTGEEEGGGGGGGAAGSAWIHAKIKKAMIRKPGPGVAGFWFATKGTEGAKRLYCSLVKKQSGKRAKVRFKPCGPRRRIYRHLKPGRYVFRVRAVGEIAADRKPAKRAFRIR